MVVTASHPGHALVNAAGNGTDVLLQTAADIDMPPADYKWVVSQSWISLIFSITSVRWPSVSLSAECASAM